MGFAHCIRPPPLGARFENSTGSCFKGAGAERRSWGIRLMRIPQAKRGFAHCIRAPPLGARFFRLPARSCNITDLPTAPAIDAAKTPGNRDDGFILATMEKSLFRV